MGEKYKKKEPSNKKRKAINNNNGKRLQFTNAVHFASKE